MESPRFIGGIFIGNPDAPPVEYLLNSGQWTPDVKNHVLRRPDGSIHATLVERGFKAVNPLPMELSHLGDFMRSGGSAEEFYREVMEYGVSGDSIIRPNGSVAARQVYDVQPCWNTAEFRDYINSRGRGYGGLGRRPTEPQGGFDITLVSRVA